MEEFPNTRNDKNATKFWSIYTSQADKHDRNLTETWKAHLDGIMIFAGLFSATVTAFIIESQKLLQQDPNDVTKVLLQQILAVNLVTASLNQSSISLPSVITTTPFHPSSLAIAVNTFWFSSLIISLASALWVTVIQQWIRAYSLKVQQGVGPVRRGQRRMFLWPTLDDWNMDDVVEYVPMLLHISLILFFAGLCIFLWTLNYSVAIVATSISGCFVAVYICITTINLRNPSLPIGTPMSLFFWNLTFRWIPLLLSYLCCKRPDSSQLISKSRIWQHQDKYRTYDHVDLSRALQWVYDNVETASDETEIEAFLACIPGFLKLLKGPAAWNLAFTRDSHDQHIYDTLTSSSSLNVSARKQRLVVCLDALFAIITKDVPQSSQSLHFSPRLSFFRRFFNQFAKDTCEEHQENFYFLSLKAVCTAGLCIHQSPGNLSPSGAGITPGLLDRLSATAADQALQELDSKRQTLEAELTKENCTEDGVKGALLDYLEKLQSASCQLDSCMKTLQKSLNNDNYWGLPDSLYSWYQSIPQSDIDSNKLYLPVIQQDETRDQLKEYTIYALRVMTFMRGTNIYPMLPDFATSATSVSTSAWYKKWFPNPPDQNVASLCQELHSVVLALDFLGIQVPESNTSRALISDALPQLNQSSPLLPSLMMKRPFSLYSSVLGEIRSDHSPAPTTALFEIVSRAYDLKAPELEHAEPEGPQQVITTTLKTLYPDQTYQTPHWKTLPVKDDVRLFFIGVLRMICTWIEDTAKTGDGNNRYCPFLKEDIMHLVNQAKSSGSSEDQRFARWAFDITQVEPTIMEVPQNDSTRNIR